MDEEGLLQNKPLPFKNVTSSCEMTVLCFDLTRENAIELLQRYRRDRQVLLNYILSGNLIKKVVMPPGAISLDDVDIDQVSVDYVLNCAKKGEI